MLKIVKADKDTYITNKVIRGKRKFNSNVGAAGTLDLFKLYGASMSGSTPNTELSRILVHFDLSEVKKLVSEGKLDYTDPSFFCKLKLKDVYGGQPTPVNYTVNVFPLSASFDEGIGKDVSYYSDYDICNWITSSLTTKWVTPGCGNACNSTSPGDYITSSISLASTVASQNFVKGDEDLVIDVTKLMSATLSNELPDRGFRISFSENLENDNKSYFVKRFASSNAYDESKRPHLSVGFNDSISDDTQNLVFDSSCKLTLYNTVAETLSNIVSGSALIPITGSNCLKLKLMTEISGGYYSLTFSGSQFSYGSNPATGIYQSNVVIPSTDSTISAKIIQSGSVNFTPVWLSNDQTIAFVTGSVITARPASRRSSNLPKNYIVTTHDLKDTYRDNEEFTVRINIFDESNPYIKASKLPVDLQGIVVKNAYYQIKDVTFDNVVVSFDDTNNSTKISSDSLGMYFKLDTSNLTAGRSYVIEVMIKQNGQKTTFYNVSPVFRIEKSE